MIKRKKKGNKRKGKQVENFLKIKTFLTLYLMYPLSGEGRVRGGLGQGSRPKNLVFSNQRDR